MLVIVHNRYYGNQYTTSFYQNLYSTLSDQANLSYEDFFPQNFTEGLDEQSINECEGLLTDVECLESLKTMASNKSPGTDGLPAEFYKVFWDYVKPFLLNALNCSYTNGHLSITQRRGLITLVPKKNKPANLLKNWRPITLLNCDYKIAAKSIANRIKKVLPKIINNDQTGFRQPAFRRVNLSLGRGAKSTLLAFFFRLLK